MATYKNKELIIGIVMLGVALGYLVLALSLPGHSGVDATFVPLLLAAMLCLLAVIQVFTAFKAPRAEAHVLPEMEQDASASTLDVGTVVKTLALITGYIALMNRVGFPIMTAVYLYLQFIVLTPLDHKVRHVSYVLTAVITSALIYLLFREAFDLMLPAGITNF